MGDVRNMLNNLKLKLNEATCQIGKLELNATWDDGFV